MNYRLRSTSNHWRLKFHSRDREPTKAYIYFVENIDLDLDEFDRLVSQSDGTNSPELPMLQDWLNCKLRDDRLRVIPKRGDLIQVAILTDCNHGLYIIDYSDESETFVVRDLYYGADDYGSLPPDFTLDQFPPSYHEAICHNSFRWLPLNILDLNPEQNLFYTTPLQLFVQGGILECNLRPRPYLKTTTNDGTVYHIIGVMDGDEEELINRKQKFMASFKENLKGVEYNGIKYLQLCSKDPVNKGSRLELPRYTLFSHC